MQPTEVQFRLLAPRLERETDARCVTEMARLLGLALAHLTPAQRATVSSAAASALGRFRMGPAAVALVGLAGPAAAEDEVVATVLLRLFWATTDLSVRREVGRFLSAQQIEQGRR